MDKDSVKVVAISSLTDKQLNEFKVDNKRDTKFVLMDDRGYFYNKVHAYKTKKEAEEAADDWNNYYSLPMFVG